MDTQERLVFWINELNKSDVQLVGKKCANLGELYNGGFPVPFGFALSMRAYEKFLTETGAERELRAYFSSFQADPSDPQDIPQFEKAEHFARSLLESTKMPPELEELICKYYTQLCEMVGRGDAWVSVRSSGPVSRPGQYETYLFVRTEKEVVKHIIKVWSSTFNTRSLIARARAGFPLYSDPIGVAVIEMVDAKAAGVFFSFEPSSFSLTTIAIEAAWGLGESVVSGRVPVDRWYIDRSTLEVVRAQICAKTEEFVLADPKTGGANYKPVPLECQNEPCLTADELKAVADLGLKVEAHFGQPQDIEWAIRKGESIPRSIVLLQARPQKITKGKFGLV